MTYIPLHHKYRPQTFKQLVGQEAIATTLSNALLQNRIAPAYLFTGARGTGKTSSARIFAKSLNCMASNAPTDQPCGKCQACQEITKGIALDVIEIDAASNTGVDNIRELIERSQFAPVQCRYKAFVIDEVHMLSNAAFSALLKTLEEPAERVVFILATTDPQRVLPTIISRCQRFDFRRIPIDAMTQHLGTIAQKEQIPITDEALYLVAQISQGGLRDAESLLDQLSLLSGDVTVDRVWDLVGAVPERDLLALLEAIAQNNPEAVLDTTRRLMDRGREPLIVLQNLASFYRDLLIAKTAPNRGDLVALTAPTWAQLCEFARSLSIETILTGQQRLKESEVQLKHTTQPRLWLEVTLMGLLPSAIPAVSDSVAQTVSIPVVKPSKPSIAPTIGETIKPNLEQAPISEPAFKPSLDELWQKVINNLQPLGTQALLKQQGSLLSFDGEEAQIGIASHKLLGMAQGRSKNIQAAFVRTLGKEIKFTLTVAAATSPTETPTSEPESDPTASKIAMPLAHDNVTESPPEPTPPESQAYATSDWDDDEVTRAAKNLAEAFNGMVIDLEDSTPDAIEPAEAIALPEASLLEEAIDDDEDEDVPF